MGKDRKSTGATSTNTNEVMDGDLKAFITKQNELIRKDIKEIRDSVGESEKNIKILIDKQYNDLSSRIQLNSDELNLAHGKAIEAHNLAKANEIANDQQDERISHLEEKCESLVTDMEKLQQVDNIKSMQIAQLRYRLEDQTNRNCRKTHRTGSQRIQRGNGLELNQKAFVVSAC